MIKEVHYHYVVFCGVDTFNNFKRLCEILDNMGYKYLAIKAGNVSGIRLVCDRYLNLKIVGGIIARCGQ